MKYKVNKQTFVHFAYVPRLANKLCLHLDPCQLFVNHWLCSNGTEQDAMQSIHVALWAQLIPECLSLYRRACKHYTGKVLRAKMVQKIDRDPATTTAAADERTVTPRVSIWRLLTCTVTWSIIVDITGWTRPRSTAVPCLPAVHVTGVRASDVGRRVLSSVSALLRLLLLCARKHDQISSRFRPKRHTR